MVEAGFGMRETSMEHDEILSRQEEMPITIQDLISDKEFLIVERRVTPEMMLGVNYVFELKT